MSWGEYLNRSNKYPNGMTWMELKDGFNYFDEVDGILVGEMAMPSEHFPYAQWVKDRFPLRIEEIYVFKGDGRNNLQVRFSFNSLVNTWNAEDSLDFYSYKDGKYYNNFLSRNSKINQILEENEIGLF